MPIAEEVSGYTVETRDGWPLQLVDAPHARPPDGEEPILVLDDVFATLDADRRAALAAVARFAEQTLITAAMLDDVPTELRGAVFQIAGGQAVPLTGAPP